MITTRRTRRISLGSKSVQSINQFELISDTWSIATQYKIYKTVADPGFAKGGG